MDLDPVPLLRFQFAWLIGWHILVPVFTVGMASFIAFLEGWHVAPADNSIHGSRCSGTGYSLWHSVSAW